MSLFVENKKPGLIKVRITPVWKFWVWVVEYEGVPFLDRSGFTLTQLKAIAKARKAVEAIGRYRKKMGIMHPENEGTSNGS